MAKKVVIISSSYRENGNSESLAKSFAAGAKESGNEIDFVFLRDYKIGFCHGCAYCSSHGGHCWQKDDAEALVSKMKEADAIVLATPTYFYSMSGQLKTLIDRTVMAYPLAGKTFYYLISSQDTDETLVGKVLSALRGFSVDCCENSVEGGWVLAMGVYEMGSIAKTAYRQKAFELGKNVR